MSLTTAKPKAEDRSRDINQIIYLLSGVAGTHQQAVRLTGYSDPSTYALYVRNQSSPGYGLYVSDSSDVALLKVHDSGVDVRNFHFMTQAAPATPESGRLALYAGTDNFLYYRTSDGVIHPINYNPQPINYLVDPGFEIWDRGTAGTSTNGDWICGRWQLAVGGGATTSAFRVVALDVNSQYAARITHSSVGAASAVNQSIENYLQFASSSVTFSARVQTNVANAVKLIVNDGILNVGSSFHTGSNAVETLTVTIPVGAAPTHLTCSFSFATVGSSYNAYLDNAVLTPGTSAAAFSALPLHEELQRIRRYRQVVEFSHTGRAYNSGITTTYLYDSKQLIPVMPVSPSPTLTKALMVTNAAGADQAFTEVLTAGSSSVDTFALHSINTAWSKASNLENVVLIGTVIVEVNP